MAYIHCPGHTLKGFDKKGSEAVNKYRQTYLERSKGTAAYINKIITFIAKEGPEAMVYLFGDHGPWMSRADAFEKDDTFFVQDRFGVFGGSIQVTVVPNPLLHHITRNL